MEMHINTTTPYPSTNTRRPIIKRIKNNKFWQKCRDIDTEFPMGKMNGSRRWMVRIFVQQCECSQCHRTVYSKWFKC